MVAKRLPFICTKDVKWHDGPPFSSADVKYTIERIMTPIVTIGSLQFVALLGGVVVTERV
jgi:ABC-type transport system substrate-binding protein